MVTGSYKAIARARRQTIQTMKAGSVTSMTYMPGMAVAISSV
ncbi:hypothetical protein [Caulobacter sp. BP25]|nr:hypothetical protein [Caulobacter sp. BP25]